MHKLEMCIVILLTPPPTGNGNTSAFSTDELVMYIYFLFQIGNEFIKCLFKLYVFNDYCMLNQYQSKIRRIFRKKKPTNVL